MFKVLRSRLSYANVMATVAVFLALGGSAYALSGVPDAGGVFHGCVNQKTGGLRVVASARSCRAVKKRHGRVVDPGEFAIAWNAQGQSGAAGQQGQQGQQGKQGLQGLTGPSGVTNVTIRVASNTCSTLHCLAEAVVGCHPGEHVTGGGAQAQVGDGIAQSAPNPPIVSGTATPAGWTGQSRDNAGDGSAAVDVYVICASP
jgi:hypothetical protein